MSLDTFTESNNKLSRWTALCSICIATTKNNTQQISTDIQLLYKRMGLS